MLRNFYFVNWRTKIVTAVIFCLSFNSSTFASTIMAVSNDARCSDVLTINERYQRLQSQDLFREGKQGSLIITNLLNETFTPLLIEIYQRVISNRMRAYNPKIRVFPNLKQSEPFHSLYDAA